MAKILSIIVILLSIQTYASTYSCEETFSELPFFPTIETPAADHAATLSKNEANELMLELQDLSLYNGRPHIDDLVTVYIVGDFYFPEGLTPFKEPVESFTAPIKGTLSDGLTDYYLFDLGYTYLIGIPQYRIDFEKSHLQEESPRELAAQSRIH